jgi:hypothetical protein
MGFKAFALTLLFLIVRSYSGLMNADSVGRKQSTGL